MADLHGSVIIFFAILGAATSVIVAWAITAVCRGRRSGKVDCEGEQIQIAYMRDVRTRNQKMIAACNFCKYRADVCLEMVRCKSDLGFW